MADKVKAAVVGVGLIGEQHAETYHEYGRSELVLVHDLNPERAKTVAERFDCRGTSNLADVANSDAQVVSVATPDHLHYEATMAMLAAGKHIVVEKPLATVTKEARAMVDAARANGVKLTINLGNRWNPSFINLRDSIKSGEIGEPVYAYSRCADTIWVPTEMLSWAGKSGPQWFLFAHTMDLLRWFLGQEAHEVYAVGTKRVLKARGIDAFDTIQAIVKFDSTHVVFETGWILPEAWPAIVEFELTINGSECRLDAEGYQTNEHIRCKATANGDKLDVSFVSFKDSGMNNQFGKKIYAANQPLFILTKQGNSIATTWQGYSKNDIDTTGKPTFRKLAGARQ